MGSSYNYFDPVSYTTSLVIGLEQKINRLLLKIFMEKHGFKNLIENDGIII